MNKKKNKPQFQIGDTGSFDDNIKRLQRELGGEFSEMQGAPRIQEEKEDTKPKKNVYRNTPSTPFHDKPLSKKKDQLPVRRHKSEPTATKSISKHFNPLKSSKFYILIFGIVAFALILFKAPVFKYTTPYRPDNDIAEIEVGYRYYNNIFGRQTKNITIVRTGKREIELPMSMAKWINLDKEKKWDVLRYYLN